LVLVGMAVFGVQEDATIHGTVASVFDVTFVTSSLYLGTLPNDGTAYNGITEDKFLYVKMNSNENYTVEVHCSGNLEQTDNTMGRYEIETEYAIWKSSDWNDNWCQQNGYTGTEEKTYTGYLPHVVDVGFYDRPTAQADCWFEAEKLNDQDAGHVYAAGGNVNDETATGLQLFNNIGFVPTKYFTTSGWHNIRYNYGSNSEIKIFPYLSPFEDYGTPAGSYSGTVTILISQADSWEDVAKSDTAYTPTL